MIFPVSAPHLTEQFSSSLSPDLPQSFSQDADSIHRDGLLLITVLIPLPFSSEPVELVAMRRKSAYLKRLHFL